MKTIFKAISITLLFSSFYCFSAAKTLAVKSQSHSLDPSKQELYVSRDSGLEYKGDVFRNPNVPFIGDKSALTISPLLNYKISGMSKVETFFGNNISLFNNNNYNTDKIWFLRQTTDINFDIDYNLGAHWRCTLRSKNSAGVLGSSGRTGVAETRLLDAVNRDHTHDLTLLMPWMRECYFEADMAHLLDLDFIGSHTIKIGLFPFELDPQGIALGSAYAVGPEALGFYTNATIDQYAFGLLFSGDLVKNHLKYDVYTAVLQNKSSSLGDTSAKIFGQEIDRIARPERGFGKINFVVAGRLPWTVFNSKILGKLIVTPFVMYNSDPEQKIEFKGDSSSKLGTIGYAADYVGNRFELGIDTAFNMGRQRVKGWDRNQIIEKNVGGSVVLVNSHVVDGDGNNILFVANSAAQKIIDNTTEVEESNGAVIGVDATRTLYPDKEAPVTLSNSANRFRDAYNNVYQGWMAVFDGLAWVYKKDLSVGVSAGVASGDDNPNIDTQDRAYSGFIGLQEIYSGGSRVRSAFVLGGAGKLPRPLSEPESNQAPSPFSNQVSGFSNLVFGGTSLKWAPTCYKHKFTVNPNILSYWQHYQTKAYSAQLAKELSCDAHAHLGVEVNTFFDYYPSKNIKIFGVGSMFIPGQHYADIKGKPLNKDQQRVINEFNRTGYDQDRVPNIGTDIAYTINIGMQFNF